MYGRVARSGVFRHYGRSQLRNSPGKDDTRCAEDRRKHTGRVIRLTKLGTGKTSPAIVKNGVTAERFRSARDDAVGWLGHRNGDGKGASSAKDKQSKTRRWERVMPLTKTGVGAGRLIQPKRESVMRDFGLQGERFWTRFVLPREA